MGILSNSQNAGGGFDTPYDFSQIRYPEYRFIGLAKSIRPPRQEGEEPNISWQFFFAEEGRDTDEKGRRLPKRKKTARLWAWERFTEDGAKVPKGEKGGYPLDEFIAAWFGEEFVKALMAKAEKAFDYWQDNDTPYAERLAPMLVLPDDGVLYAKHAYRKTQGKDGKEFHVVDYLGLQLKPYGHTLPERREYQGPPDSYGNNDAYASTSWRPPENPDDIPF